MQKFKFMILEIISLYQILKSHYNNQIHQDNTRTNHHIHTDNNRTQNFGINSIFKTASTLNNDLNDDLKILNKQQFKNNLKRIDHVNLLRYAFQNLK
jgi:hypothetical protein